MNVIQGRAASTLTRSCAVAALLLFHLTLKLPGHLIVRIIGRRACTRSPHDCADYHSGLLRVRRVTLH